MEQVFKRPECLIHVPFHFCPGCHHGVVHRLVAEAIDHFKIREKTIGVASVRCSVFMYDYFNVDVLEAPHGRASAVASGVKRAKKDAIVFTIQGDGDLGAIGIAEGIHTANRGENITLIHRYHQLNRKYQFCRAKSEAVSALIRAIEEVSEALFAEWEKELNEYTNRTLKNHSKQQLKLARQNYARLIKALHMAEAKIHPVLSAFKDQVLYLKHNLNAQAIAALQHEFIVIDIDIAQLILAMEQTIAEASRFVSVLSDRKALPSA